MTMLGFTAQASLFKVVEAVLNHRSGTVRGVAGVYNAIPTPPKRLPPSPFGRSMSSDAIFLTFLRLMWAVGCL